MIFLSKNHIYTNNKFSKQLLKGNTFGNLTFIDLGMLEEGYNLKPSPNIPEGLLINAKEFSFTDGNINDIEYQMTFIPSYTPNFLSFDYYITISSNNGGMSLKSLDRLKGSVERLYGIDCSHSGVEIYTSDRTFNHSPLVYTNLSVRVPSS